MDSLANACSYVTYVLDDPLTSNLVSTCCTPWSLQPYWIYGIVYEGYFTEGGNMRGP